MYILLYMEVITWYESVVTDNFEMFPSKPLTVNPGIT